VATEQMTSILHHYFFFILIASIGVVQIAASYVGISKLAFFKRPLWGYLFGLAAIAAAYLWFFICHDLHVRHINLEGKEQLGGFALGVGAGVFISNIVSSLIHHKGSAPAEAGEGGLETLKETTYLKVMVANARALPQLLSKLPELWRGLRK